MGQKIDERLQKAAMEYYPTMPPRTLGDNKVMAENFKQSYMRDAFIAGTQWQRNSIWHDASEEPEIGKKIIMLSGIPEYESISESGTYIGGRFFKTILDEKMTLMSDCKWCYLSDILPTKD